MERHNYHGLKDAAAVNPSIKDGELSDAAEALLLKGWMLDDENSECLIFGGSDQQYVQVSLKQSSDRLSLLICSNPVLQIGCQHANNGTSFCFRMDDWSALVMACRLLMRMKHKKEGRPPEYELVKKFLEENL